MESPILASRRELLRRTQNADGGWGYFAGKQSWLEPTAYAILALHGDKDSHAAVDRAWKLVRSWQLPNGGWKPAPHLDSATWVTSLGVTLCTVFGEDGAALEGGVAWLLRARGVENGFVYRLMAMIGRSNIDRDVRLRGWPWREGTVAWVEPTAHALVALKRAAPVMKHAAIAGRIEEAENLLLTLRSRDGGWNYGSPGALGVDLPSYPETTALAILGLQQRTPAETYHRIEQFSGSAPSRLADAWMGISLAAVGRAVAKPMPVEAPPDLMIASLEAIAAPGGNAGFFQLGMAAGGRS